MQNPLLLKLSLIISLIGILILLLLFNLLQPELIEIKNINELSINKNIQVQGSIINIKRYNNFQILTIQDKTGKIPALINKNKNLNFKPNQQITIIGRLTEYNNELQIQADKILS